MRKITTRIVHFFIESKVIDETDREIYEYGLEILSENVMLTVFLLLFGVAIGRGVETGIFLFSFCWLRRFCGGYHAKTKRGCHIATFITYIVFLIGIAHFYKVITKYMVEIYFVCLAIIILYAPVQHKNKILSESMHRKNRLKAIVYTLLFGVIIYIFKIKFPVVSFAVLGTLIQVALLMIIGRREKVIKLKVTKMMADIVYRMAEKSVDEASAWYEYQPEVPEKLKKRNSCKLVSKRSTK